MASKPSKKPAAKPAKKAVKPAPKLAAKAAVKKPAPKAPAKKVVTKTPPKAIKAAPQKPAAKAPVAKKSAVKPAAKPVAKKAVVKAAAKPAPKSSPAPKAKPPVADKVQKAAKAPASAKKGSAVAAAPSRSRQEFVTAPRKSSVQLTPFLQKQRQRLLELKDSLLDSMRGVARDNLHSGTDTSAFGMHQADAGSDAYDRDFALSMLSKEQGLLYEIDEALKRIEDGNYGICDNCQKPIKHERLEALPFTRYTVDCQSELEKRQHHTAARPQITSLFGLTEEEEENEEEENADNA